MLTPFETRDDITSHGLSFYVPGKPDCSYNQGSRMGRRQAGIRTTKIVARRIG